MTPNQLLKAAQSGKCVVWLSGRHMPATFLASMQFHRVMAVLSQIKLYKPQRKKS